MLSWEKIFKNNWEQLQLRKKNQLFSVFLRLLILYTNQENIQFDFFKKTISILPNEIFNYVQINPESLKTFSDFDKIKVINFIEQPGRFFEKLLLWFVTIKKDLNLRENLSINKIETEFLYKYLAIFQVSNR